MSPQVAVSRDNAPLGRCGLPGAAKVNVASQQSPRTRSKASGHLSSGVEFFVSHLNCLSLGQPCFNRGQKRNRCCSPRRLGQATYRRPRAQASAQVSPCDYVQTGFSQPPGRCLSSPRTPRSGCLDPDFFALHRFLLHAPPRQILTTNKNPKGSPFKPSGCIPAGLSLLA